MLPSNFWPGCIQEKKNQWNQVYAYKQDCLDTSYIFVRRDTAKKKCMFLRTCRSLMNVKFRRTEVSVFVGTKQRILGKCWANVERSVQTASTPFNISGTTCLNNPDIWFNKVLNECWGKWLMGPYMQASPSGPFGLCHATLASGTAQKHAMSWSFLLTNQIRERVD